MSSTSLIRGFMDQHVAELRAAFLESAPVGLAALDADGVVAYWNDAAELLLGWSAASLAGRRFPPLEEPGEMAALLERVRERGEAREVVSMHGADGEPVQLSLRVRTLRAPGGGVIGSAWTMMEALPDPAPAHAAGPPASAGTPRGRGGGSEWVAERLRGSVPEGASAAEVTQRIRACLAAGVHLGFLRAGEPLPSIRAIAGLTGVDHRAVAGAVRVLEGEGWVRVRERRGIFLAGEATEPPELGETGEWLAEVLAEARRLRIRLPILPALLKRMTAARPLRCGCLESTEDDLYLLCSELRRSWGLETMPLRVADGAPGTTVRMAAELRGAGQALDLLVTSPFHAPLARDLARRLDLPLLVLTLDPEIVAAVEARLRTAPLTAVVADPAFGERLRAIPGAAEGRLRVVRADDADALAALDPSEPVLLTGAARERAGDRAFRLLVPCDPFLSADSAAQLASLLIRHNTAPRPGTAADL